LVKFGAAVGCVIIGEFFPVCTKYYFVNASAIGIAMETRNSSLMKMRIFLYAIF
jgi:hypothetical protein